MYQMEADFEAKVAQEFNRVLADVVSGFSRTNEKVG